MTSLNIRTMLIATVLTFSAVSACAPQATTPRNANTNRPNKTITNNGSNSGASSGTNTDQIAIQSTSGSPTESTAGNQTMNPPVTPPASQNSECYKGDAFVCKIEALISEKTNQYRASRSLKPLRFDGKMSFVARDWSSKQANSGSISHSGFPSARNQVYRTEFQNAFSFSGENVAYTGRVGGNNQSDDAAEKVAQEFAVMWWNSAGHRANMLGRFSSIGVGVHKNARGSWYATQVFD